MIKFEPAGGLNNVIPLLDKIIKKKLDDKNADNLSPEIFKT